ncbi:uncharacterized protein J3D65DRAFT_631302 [Phyllosticta citribraziliensis]|uniref:Uncharacterized protein n=1 Tax=Phyllosticta citribraziliensis TaxID=989973 RepID=A0ABR1LGF9_9PEZI
MNTACTAEPSVRPRVANTTLAVVKASLATPRSVSLPTPTVLCPADDGHCHAASRRRVSMLRGKLAAVVALVWPSLVRVIIFHLERWLLWIFVQLAVDWLAVDWLAVDWLVGSSDGDAKVHAVGLRGKHERASERTRCATTPTPSAETHPAVWESVRREERERKRRGDDADDGRYMEKRKPWH